jgi:hypothetical protein
VKKVIFALILEDQKTILRSSLGPHLNLERGNLTPVGTSGNSQIIVVGGGGGSHIFTIADCQYRNKIYFFLLHAFFAKKINSTTACLFTLLSFNYVPLLFVY